MNNGGKKLAKIQPSDPVGNKDTLKSLLEDDRVQEQLRAVAGKFMTPDKMYTVALLAFNRNKDLFACNQSSVIDAVTRAAETGLDFGGATGQGYLVPHGGKGLAKGVKRCQFIPGYKGLLELSYRSGKVEYIDAQLVYANDTFEAHLGTRPRIIHQVKLSAHRGNIIGAYAVVYLKGSQYPKLEIMNFEQLEAIKNRSKSRDVGPWQSDTAEMHRKTVVRRVWKYLPKTPEMQTAILADNEDYENGAPEPQPTPQVPKREDRKKVEAVVKDTPEVIHDELQALLKQFNQILEADNRDTADVQAIEAAFQALFQWATGDEERQFADVSEFTANDIHQAKQCLAEGFDIPDAILEMVPKVMTPDEVAAHADELFGNGQDDKGEQDK